LDKRMNDAGLLRLMVSDPLAMNLSNTLGYLRGELKDSGKGKSPAKRDGAKGAHKKAKSWKRRVLDMRLIKKMLMAMYNKIFNWYYS
jgi:hypothetical protein